MNKRILAMLLVVCMAVALLPVSASAAEIVAEGICGDNLTWTLDGEGTLTISGEGEMYDYASPYNEDGEEISPFYDNFDIRHIVIRDGVTTIGDYAFLGCYSITEATISNTVTSIGSYAFAFCHDGGEGEDGLCRIDIPNGVTKIGDSAFFGCSNLEQISLPETLIEIGASAFAHCGNLEQISLPKSLETVGDNAFSFTNLKSVEIPGSLTVIPNGMFFECRQLREITLHEGIERIEESAFTYTRPTVIVVPSSVDYIGPYAFWFGYCYQQLVVLNPECELDGTVHWIGYVDDEFGELGLEYEATFYGYAGSTIEAYAETSSTYNFVELPAFTDVSSESWYFLPVLWAVEKGITSGTSDTTFSPYDVVERCQMVTFLWRAAGCPEPTITENPFTDVNESDYFYKAVLWAVEKGITSGTSATTFSPFDQCERCQVVTFLWRAMGKPAVENASNPFTDVTEADYFYNAILWAVENGITSGTSATTFSPFDLTERCQAVTFLYRAYN